MGTGEIQNGLICNQILINDLRPLLLTYRRKDILFDYMVASPNYLLINPDFRFKSGFGFKPKFEFVSNQD